jgi:hypothetical protein
MFDPRLVRAEILKLRRRRGMLAIALLGTVGFVLLAYGVTALQHAANPVANGPAGGTASYRDAIPTVELLVLIMGSIVGATAGTQDLESGVFRDLAATGRSRTALFGVRVTGACAITLPISALAAATTAGGAFALADGLATPPAHVVLAGTAALLAAAALSTAAGVGLGAVAGSRGPVIGMLLAFFLALQPLLAAITLLGDARALVPAEALARIGGVTGTQVHPGLALAVAVVVAWIAATLGAGARRTRRREI